MIKKSHQSLSKPWFTRQELRLVLVTGLCAGFGLLSSIPYGFYLPLTTAAVLSSTYGNSMKLGVQRLMGSLMGVIILIIFTKSLDLPLPLGLGLALASTRLLGGMLGLQVGYKVAGTIIVMGWLVHEEVEIVWGPIRLYWTCLGVVISLVACQWMWPSRTIPQLHQQFASLLNAIGMELQVEANNLRQNQPSPSPLNKQQAKRISLIRQLNAARQQQLLAQMELGVNPEQHPLHDIWSRIDLLASQIMTSLEAVRGLPAPFNRSETIKQLHLEEALLLDILSTQILKTSDVLINRKTIAQQKLNPIKIKEINALSLSTNQWLDQALEKTLSTGKSDFSKQQLQQIMLRVSLIDYIRSAIIEATTPFSPDSKQYQRITQ